MIGNVTLCTNDLTRAARAVVPAVPATRAATSSTFFAWADRTRLRHGQPENR